MKRRFILNKSQYIKKKLKHGVEVLVWEQRKDSNGCFSSVLPKNVSRALRCHIVLNNFRPCEYGVLWQQMHSVQLRNWDRNWKSLQLPWEYILRYGNYYSARAFPIKEIPQSSWAQPNACLSITARTHTHTHTHKITEGFTLTPAPCLHFCGDQLLASLSQWQVGRPLRGCVCDFLQIVLICLPLCADSPQGISPLTRSLLT